MTDTTHLLYLPYKWFRKVSGGFIIERNTIVIIAAALIIGFVLGGITGTYGYSVLPAGQPCQPGNSPAPSGNATESQASLPSEFISFLFVQEAQQGSLTHGENGTLTLTLNATRADTVYFSDRPARVSGVVDTRLFTDSSMWRSGNNPNAALMLPDEPPANDTVIVTLSSPRYDHKNATLVYNAEIVPDYKGEGLKAYEGFVDPGVAERFGRVMLFIDSARIPVDFFNAPHSPENQTILFFPVNKSED